jgi:riboflavin synthase
MFTGIVEEVGRVRAVTRNATGVRLEIAATTVLEDARVGASIAVNGCCLTVVACGDGWWSTDAVAETLDRTNLGQLAPGDPVNLERPLRLADRLGGHLVQGHVDATGTVEARHPEPDGSVRLHVAAPGDVLRYVVTKGSIAVDGISLTIAARDPAGFVIAVIPHTLEATTLGTTPVGTRVNLEVDMIAKYVSAMVADSR